MTEIIAHRGGADLWPENTMAAFAGAIACGADGAELDVHLTQDGEVVVFHDEALKPEIVRRRDRTWLSRTGPLIKEMKFSELLNYDVGRLQPGTAYAARHPEQAAEDGEHIPRLADVIALAQARSKTFKLWIELKTDLMNPERGADPVALADATLAVLRDAGFEDRTVFISFDWRTLVRIKGLAPEIPALATTLPQSWFAPGDPPAAHGPPPPDELAAMRAMVAAGAPWEGDFASSRYPTLQDAVKASGVDGWFPFYPDVTQSSARSSANLGLKLAAWTVPARSAPGLVSLGCSAICTDNPVSLQHILSKTESSSASGG